MIIQQSGGRDGLTWILPRLQAGNRSERDRVGGNHHLNHVAESTVSDTGTLLRDGNGSGEYLEGQPSRESPEALA